MSEQVDEILKRRAERETLDSVTFWRAVDEIAEYLDGQ